MNRHLSIGSNALSGTNVILDLAELYAHWAIIGGSGKGKSRLLASILRYCIDSKIPVVVLDPGEELYRWGVSYAALSGKTANVCCIDLNDPGVSFGFDWKKCYGVSPVTLAEQFYRTIRKVYGQPDETVAPLTETWMRNTLVPLIECPEATFAEMLEFASPSQSALRAAILRKTHNEFIRREWESFDSLKRSEREQLVMPVHNRAAKLTIPDEARRMIGQVDPPFDLGEAIEQRKVVLVNLAPTRVSRELQRAFGITLVNQIVNYAYRRTPKQRRNKTLLLCDEASEYASDDLPLALDKLRKFGIFFVLAYQTLAQAEKIPGYVDSLFANTNVKIAFKTSRRDAEELVGEMFPDGLTKDEVKDEIVHKAWDPVESTRTVKARGSSVGRSTSSGSSTAISSASTNGAGSSSTFTEPASSHLSHSGTFSQGTQESIGYSSMDSESYSYAETVSESDSESEAVVPFYEYLARNEVSSRTYYSVDELRERYISWFLLQPMRHAQVKIGDRKTVPVITAYVPDIRARERDRQKVIERSNAKYALPVAEVDRRIEERRRLLLQESEFAEAIEVEAEVLETTRWQ